MVLAGCTLTDRIRSFLHDEASSTIAVKVGDRSYSKADLERYFDSRLSEFRDPKDADKIKSNLLESFIEDRLLLFQAESMNIEPNPETVRKMMEQMAASGLEGPGETANENREAALKRNLTESLKMQQYLHDHLLKENTVPEEACEAYYNGHLGEFIRNDQVHLREILVDNQTQAEKLRAALKENQNKNFAELASVYSKAPSAADGGDLGTFQRGELPEQFEKVVFGLSPGTASKIVRTQYGYHIFLIEERISAHQMRYQEVRDQIREKLLREQERKLIEKELVTLTSRIPIEIHQNNLDFKYVGTHYAVR